MTASTGRKRASTRPPKQTRNAEATRARILEKATEIFAESGYDGASLGDIVKASKVNKRMVYHYFGDKQGLYRPIFRQQWHELKQRFEAELERRFGVGSGEEREIGADRLLYEAVGIVSDFMADHRLFVRLMMWEGLEGGQVSRSLWTEVRGPLYAQVEFLIRQAQSDGKLNPKLDPAHLVISFLGAVGFYFAYAPTLTDILQRDPFASSALEERKVAVQRLFKALATR
jgi:TetR/AcrR family transcriptional regulator